MWTWGVSRAELAATTPLGQIGVFNFQATAPAAEGTYNFSWKMLQEMVEWFGPDTPNTAVTVALQGDTVTYIHNDALGSPVARSDSAGNVISRTSYEPYGRTASGVEPTIGFTGHVNDADTGLVYMQQRYYDPLAGRFLNVDPVVTDANKGLNFNRYSYANNGPYRYIDPDGRCPVERDGVVCTAVLAPNVRISDPHLLEGINKMAAELNMPIEVYIGNRDAGRNANAGGARNSAHLSGNGADVKIPGKSKAETAKIIFNSTQRTESGIRQIYHRPDNGRLPEHTHLDTKSGPDLQQDPGGRYSPLRVLRDD